MPLIAFVFILLTALLALLYPRTTLISGVQRQALDANGKIKDQEELRLEKRLSSIGVKTIYKVQTGSGKESTVFEWAARENSIDTFIVPNTCAIYEDQVKEKFRSIGVIKSVPMFFLSRYSDRSIDSLSDIKGKTIAYRLLPKDERSGNFDENGKHLSPYSIEYILGQILETAGISTENTRFINTYPLPVTASVKADVFWGMYWPNDTVYMDVMKDLSSKKLKVLDLKNLHGLASHVRCLNIKTIPAGSIDFQSNVPEKNIDTIFVTGSILVRSSLDPSLVTALAESYKDILTKPGRDADYPFFDKSESFLPHPAAEEYYKNGGSIIQEYLTPALYMFLVKALFILVPLFTIIIPLISNLPSLYYSFAKTKIAHYYKALAAIESGCINVDETSKQTYLQELDRIDDNLRGLRLMFLHSHFVQDIYTVKEHIELVRSKILNSSLESSETKLLVSGNPENK